MKREWEEKCTRVISSMCSLRVGIGPEPPSVSANCETLFGFLLRSLPPLLFLSLLLGSHSRAAQLGVVSVTSTAEVLLTKVTERGGASCVCTRLLLQRSDREERSPTVCY